MAITLMTTTGSQEAVNAALGVTPLAKTDPVSTDVLTGTVETLDPQPVVPPVVAAPGATAPERVVGESVTPPPVGEEPVPDSEFDEDGEPTTERAARSSHSKLQTIKKLRVRAREAETKAARLEGENAVLRAGHPKDEPLAPAPVAPTPGLMTRAKPTPEDINPATGELLFACNEDYVEALVDWKQDERDARRQAIAREQVLTDQRQAFTAEHPDFPEVLAKANFDINVAQQQVLNDPDNPHAVAMVYALAKDPVLCESIRKMPYHQALMALGKLQASLEPGAPAPPPAVPAPKVVPLANLVPPPTVIRGTTAPSTVSLEQAAKANDISTFFAIRAAEDARKRLSR